MPLTKRQKDILYGGAGAGLALGTIGFIAWTRMAHGSTSTGGGGGGGGTPNLALQSPTFYRTVNARMYQGTSTSGLVWALPTSETPTTVGDALASMRSSFVSGLIRFDTGFISGTSSQVITDFETVQTAVKAVNPTCKFDVAIRGNEYTTGAAIAADINAVLSLMPSVDAFWVSVYDVMNSDTQAGAVNAAHAAGKLLGGDINDPTHIGGGTTTTNVAAITTIPDYLTFPDWGFQLPPASAMTNVLSYNTPALMHVNNSAIPVDSSGNTEHNDWVNLLQPSTLTTISWGDTTIPSVNVSRQSFIQYGAQNQADNGYGFEYPVYWPEGAIGSYYSAPADDATLSFEQTAIDTYNAAVKPPPG